LPTRETERERKKPKTNDPWNILPSPRRKPARGIIFFSKPMRTRTMRWFQTPSLREAADSPFSCLIYSDKSFRRNGYKRARRRPHDREYFVCLVHLRISPKCFEISRLPLVDLVRVVEVRRRVRICYVISWFVL